MPRVTFTQKFDWTDPRLPQVTTAYKAGHTYMVTTPCAASAIANGKAKPLAAPAQEPTHEPEQAQNIQERAE